jgi:hypothetical protein
LILFNGDRSEKSIRIILLERSLSVNKTDELLIKRLNVVSKVGKIYRHYKIQGCGALL